MDSKIKVCVCIIFNSKKINIDYLPKIGKCYVVKGCVINIS